MKKIVSLLLLVVLFSSCNEYQKALKNEDIGKVWNGTKMYEAGKYSKAILEQIVLNIEENPMRSCFICFHNHYKTKNIHCLIPIWKFVSSYPKWEVARSSLFRTKLF
jgi:outer membrane protein assembly factor BamD